MNPDVSKILGLIVICFSVFAAAQEDSGMKHASCQWCHTPDVTSFQPRATSAIARKQVRAAPVCLSCHDGITAGSPGDQSSAHYSSGLDCLACHDPHDQSGSYRMLRGKSGRQTQQTASLEFCRDCHNH